MKSTAESRQVEPRDLTRKTNGPRPYTVTITDWHGTNPRVFSTNGGDALPDDARAYYDEQRRAAMTARDAWVALQ